MPKLLLALLLGAFGFPLLFVGEGSGGSGLLGAFILVAAYFTICQFLLSRGNGSAYRTDWPVMLALDAAILVVVVIMAFVEGREVIRSQGLGALLACCGGTYTGAVAASFSARRKAVLRG